MSDTRPSELAAPPEGAPDAGSLDEIYGRRFDDAEGARKQAIWLELGRYLQRYVPEDGAVVDVACDRGDFVHAVRARERWATDVRDVSGALEPGVRFVRTDGLALAEHLPRGHFDAAFMSNYLEHLPSGDHVVRQLAAVAEILRPGGRVIVLQPNIRLVGGAYWDFIDHKTALTEKSLVEAASICGFATEALVTRFLPYTTKSRLPQSRVLVRAYLACRPAWYLLGKQTLYVGRRA